MEMPQAGASIECEEGGAAEGSCYGQPSIPHPPALLGECTGAFVLNMHQVRYLIIPLRWCLK